MTKMRHNLIKSLELCEDFKPKELEMLQQLSHWPYKAKQA